MTVIDRDSRERLPCGMDRRSFFSSTAAAFAAAAFQGDPIARAQSAVASVSGHPANTIARDIAIVTPDEYQGLRITPNVYTTLEEIDTFTEVMTKLIKAGSIPA